MERKKFERNREHQDISKIGYVPVSREEVIKKLIALRDANPELVPKTYDMLIERLISESSKNISEITYISPEIMEQLRILDKNLNLSEGLEDDSYEQSSGLKR